MKYFNKTSLCLLLVVVFGWLSLRSASGPGTYGYACTGAPFNSYNTCKQPGCHISLGVYSPVVSVQVLNGTTPITAYTPGASYTVKISLSSTVGTPGGYGFQITCVKSSNSTDINTWGTPPSNTHVVGIPASAPTRHYFEHDAMLSSGTISIPWTAPAAGTGGVKFYLVGNIVNGNNSNTGDNVDTTSLLIPENCSAPSLSEAALNINACTGGNNGGVTLTTTGGSAPFTYSWTGPGSYIATTQNISGLATPGVYQVVVTATGGCKDSTTATVSVVSQIALTASSNARICHGSNLTFTSSVTGGDGTYTYSWTGPNSFTSGIANPSITAAGYSASGNYFLTVHDASSCIGHDTLLVAVDSMPRADSIRAASTSSSSFNFSAANPHFMETYNWSFGDAGTATASSNALQPHAYSAIGTYTVRLVGVSPCGSDTITKTIHVTALSVGNMAKENSAIHVYPNPARSFVVVNNAGNAELSTIAMYDMRGVKVFEKILNGQKECRINTEKLPSGNYMINIVTQEGVINSKIQLLK